MLNLMHLMMAVMLDLLMLLLQVELLLLLLLLELLLLTSSHHRVSLRVILVVERLVIDLSIGRVVHVLQHVNRLIRQLVMDSAIQVGLDLDLRLDS